MLGFRDGSGRENGMLPVVRLALIALVAGAVGSAWAQAPLAEPIRPLPLGHGIDLQRAALGRALFYDVRLSRQSTQNCASCHQLGKGGADGKALSSLGGALRTRFNTPTVYNSSFNIRQGWTGRHRGVDGLLDHVLTAPPGGTTWDLVALRLAGDGALATEFNAVYGSDVSAALLKDALGSYLQTLVTPSRFDRHLRGDKAALSHEEKLGYARFKSFGCVACHQGINVGGNMYQKFGAMRPLAPGAAMAADPGRFELTGKAADRHLFRVPSLRNVALTAPYFHNGSVATLDEAVDAMVKYQLGRTATASDRALLVRFLETLSGEVLPPRGAQP
jgi:cytochrome c peroxidase